MEFKLVEAESSVTQVTYIDQWGRRVVIYPNAKSKTRPDEPKVLAHKDLMSTEIERVVGAQKQGLKQVAW
jgi:hypothetical protein